MIAAANNRRLSAFFAAAAAVRSTAGEDCGYLWYEGQSLGLDMEFLRCIEKESN